jgi:hypothetical protein
MIGFDFFQKFEQMMKAIYDISKIKSVAIEFSKNNYLFDLKKMFSKIYPE